MKNKKINKTYRWLFVLFILALIITNVQNSYGTEPPSLSNIVIKATIDFNGQSGVYTYQYTIKNSEQNTGNLVGLDIDIAYPSGGVGLKKEGLAIPYGKWSRTFEQSVPQYAKVTMIPVGMEKPDKWIAGLSVFGTASWGGGDYVQLKPGQSLSGFGLTSYGLPGIREFKSDPSIDVDADYYPGWESVKGAADESKAIIAKVDEFMEKVSAHGKTIGPTAPPAVFKPEAFLDYIIDLKHQAASLGWIDNSGIINSLDVKLDNVKKKLGQGDNGVAKNILNAFINDVEAQAGKHLTSEAYALLKFNALYLISNLAK